MALLRGECGMTEKRFDYVMNEYDEIEYITDIVDCENRDFVDFLDFANTMANENEQLKQTIETQIFNYENAKGVIHSSEHQIQQLQDENEQLKQKILDEIDLEVDYVNKVYSDGRMSIEQYDGAIICLQELRRKFE